MTRTPQEELDEVLHQLKTNVSMVYVNMLRGEIIKPPPRHIQSLYPGKFILVEDCPDIEEDADTRL